MEPIKINVTTPVNSFKSVNIKDIIERDNELIIKLVGSECYNVYSGQTLTFIRYVYTSGNAFYTLSQNVTVTKEDDDHTIHTTLLPTNKIMLKKDWFYNETDEMFQSFKLINGSNENGPYSYYKIKTQNNHHIFPQDLANCIQEIVFKDCNGKILATYGGNDISIPLKTKDRSVLIDDCITQIDIDETCGKNFKNLVTYQYNYSPETVDMNALLISGFSEHIVDEMAYIETKYNTFYNYYVNVDDDGTPNEYDEYGNIIKHCVLYKDSWWQHYSDENNTKNGFKYINGGSSDIVFGYNNYYWSVNVGLSSPTDESTLGSEDNFNSKFVSDLEESLIPEFIDMERVKYSPMVYDSSKKTTVYYKWVSNNDKKYGVIYTVSLPTKNTTTIDVYKSGFTKIEDTFYVDSTDGYALYREEYNDNIFNSYIYTQTNEIVNDALSIATSITFSLHFRERNKIEDEERKNNTAITSGHVYSDGWYINPDSGDTVWWNGFNYSGSAFPAKTFKTFINENGLTSDLLGYLNFVDNDVYYRKKKVSQSFIRLTFYNSKDPIEQKLLYYSTVFLDATNLYGKYIKQLMYIEESGVYSEKNLRSNQINLNANAKVVMCSANTASSRVDTKIVITNEYDRTKSSEGFNLYLFSEDSNFNIENGEKTIYMKVEFNHAGNGKTIPMIMWPKDENGNYKALLSDNFIDSLYIPIRVVYINGRFAYYIPDAYKNENGNIDLVLFEPKIDYPDDVPEDYE